MRKYFSNVYNFFHVVLDFENLVGYVFIKFRKNVLDFFRSYFFVFEKIWKKFLEVFWKDCL